MSTILVLAPYVPHPPTHGGSIRSRVLLDALCEDHVVHLAVPIGGPRDQDAAAALRRVLRVTVHEVPVPASPRPAAMRKLWSWARGRSELLARRWGAQGAGIVAGLAATLRPDLVVADSSFVLPVVPKGDWPLVLHLHNLESLVFARADTTRRGILERLTRRCEAKAIAAAECLALRRAALAITVADGERAVALAMAPGATILTVPNSVDVQRRPLLPPSPTSAPVRLLFVGTTDYPPNHEAIVELVTQHLPVLRREFPGLVVRLVGRDDAGRLATFSGIAGVEGIGPVDDLAPHYRDCHAVYLPIRSGGGTRIKILEAWAFGRPVLSTAVGAEALEAEEGRHWRRIESPAQGATVLREVLAGQGAALVREGRALVEARYSHAAAVAALRSAFGGITTGR